MLYVNCISIKLEGKDLKERAELQIKMNFIFNYIYFYHYIKEKKDVLRQRLQAFREVLLEKETERVKLFYRIIR